MTGILSVLELKNNEVTNGSLEILTEGKKIATEKKQDNNDIWNALANLQKKY